MPSAGLKIREVLWIVTRAALDVICKYSVWVLCQCRPVVSVEPARNVIEAKTRGGGALLSEAVVVGRGKAKVVLSGEPRSKAERCFVFVRCIVEDQFGFCLENHFTRRWSPPVILGWTHERSVSSAGGTQKRQLSSVITLVS